MTTNNIRPCPKCKVLPSRLSDSPERTMLKADPQEYCKPNCECLAVTRDGWSPITHWNQYCADYVGNVVRDLGIETVEQLNILVDSFREWSDNRRLHPNEYLLKYKLLMAYLRRGVAND